MATTKLDENASNLGVGTKGRPTGLFNLALVTLQFKLYINYLSATMLPAVDDADTAVIMPGIKPDADTIVNTDES